MHLELASPVYFSGPTCSSPRDRPAGVSPNLLTLNSDVSVIPVTESNTHCRVSDFTSRSQLLALSDLAYKKKLTSHLVNFI